MEVLEPTKYPAIAKARRVASRRLSLGRDKKPLLNAGHSARAIEKQRSQQPPKGNTTQDDDLREMPKESSMQTPWVCHSTEPRTRCQDRSTPKLKRTPSVEELSRNQGSSLETRFGNAATVRSASCSPPLSTTSPEEATSTSLGQISTEIRQVSRNIREEALALEIFISEEMTAKMTEIYDSAVAQYGRAHRLLSLDIAQVPSAETSTSVGLASASRGNQLGEDDSSQVKISQDAQAKSAAVGGEEEEEERHHAAVSAAAVTGAAVPLDSSASGATIAEPVPDQDSERKGEDSRSEIPAVFGFANVEVGVSVRNSVILRNEAEGEEDRDRGAETDEGIEEGDSLPVRPVSTDISAKIMGLSSIIRRKAAQASATRRRQNHHRQQQPSRVLKARVALDS